jgi:hypothetical protein
MLCTNCAPIPNFYIIFLNLLPVYTRLTDRWGGKVKMLKSIVCTYPDFRMLPKGLKQMLLASENLFFNEVSGAALLGAGRGVENNRFWQPSASQLDTGHLPVGA